MFNIGCIPQKKYYYQYKIINKIVSEVAIGKHFNNVFYLTDEPVAFSLFDKTINEI